MKEERSSVVVGIIMTKDGTEVATATGHGISTVIESGKRRYPSALFFRTTSTGKLAFLNNLIVVNEYEIDESGSYSHKGWEWK